MEILYLKGDRKVEDVQSLACLPACLSPPVSSEYSRLYRAQLRNIILDFLSLAQAWIAMEAMRMYTPTSPKLIEFSYLCWCPHKNSRKLTFSIVSFSKTKSQLESSREELISERGRLVSSFAHAAFVTMVLHSYWETTGRCSLVSLGGLVTKLKLAALTSISAKASGVLWWIRRKDCQCSELC